VISFAPVCVFFLRSSFCIHLSTFNLGPFNVNTPAMGLEQPSRSEPQASPPDGTGRPLSSEPQFYGPSPPDDGVVGHDEGVMRGPADGNAATVAGNPIRKDGSRRSPVRTHLPGGTSKSSCADGMHCASATSFRFS
jgi:hypothetical protein